MSDVNNEGKMIKFLKVSTTGINMQASVTCFWKEEIKNTGEIKENNPHEESVLGLHQSS